MSQTSADLIRKWQAETAIIEQDIADFRTGAIGDSLTGSQREAAMKDRLEAVAAIQSLIADFSRCEVFQTSF
jgi:hypothetical protein